MMPLNQPAYEFGATLDQCVAGITGNAGLRQRLLDSKPSLESEGEQYLRHAQHQTWHTVPPLANDFDENSPLVQFLAKADLVKMYEQYFVPEEKPARHIYDSLMNSALEKCPFCGGIGTPRNLDHFLPKSRYPQYSVFPQNLVPACRDCNMDGKGQEFALTREDQIIQPYLDGSHFFEEQWVFATFRRERGEEFGVFEYYVLPPDDWSACDKERASRHFAKFALAERYATKAAEHHRTVLLQIERMTEVGLAEAEINAVLLEPGADASPFVNHWQTAMYQALMDSVFDRSQE